MLFCKFPLRKNIKLSLILGSGIELDKRIIKDKHIIHEDNYGVHHKQIYTCTIGGKTILVFKGRKHFYEGFDINEITSYIPIIQDSGCWKLLITNSAGGINLNFNVGDLMIIDSTVNLNFRLKPLNGFIQRNGGDNLDKELLNAFRNCGMQFKKGVYAYLSGPNYETNSEVAFLRRYNVDAVGMSTVPEMSYARSCGIKTSGLSIITNILKENFMISASHNEVLHVAGKISYNFSLLMDAFVSELN